MSTLQFPKFPKSLMSPVVLDTNIILDIFHFQSLDIAPLSHAVRERHICCLTDQGCMEELQRVLTYPRLYIAPEKAITILEDYRALVKSVEGENSPILLPKCRDREDQRFLELAARGGAKWLISRDKRVLQTARKKLPFEVLSPAKAVLRLLNGA